LKSILSEATVHISLLTLRERTVTVVLEASTTWLTSSTSYVV